MHFPLPTLIHGEYDDVQKVGVLVFADLYGLNYNLADPDLHRVSSQGHIEKVIKTMAAFHATCTAFEQSRKETFEEIFPFLQTDPGGGGYIWFQPDMQAYLQEMYDTCLQFLRVRNSEIIISLLANDTLNLKTFFPVHTRSRRD
jgi:hypothetical protein